MENFRGNVAVILTKEEKGERNGGNLHHTQSAVILYEWVQKGTTRLDKIGTIGKEQGFKLKTFGKGGDQKKGDKN